jgi:hypothetical protein
VKKIELGPDYNSTYGNSQVGKGAVVSFRFGKFKAPPLRFQRLHHRINHSMH